ncbi:glycosyltransferase, partial [Candidatus Kaiserbacteria bacterium]|nr:glycosyltransferase [Candidatus Kaiserbacteria bacterium]
QSYHNSWVQRLRVLYGRYVVRRTQCIRVVSERIKRSLVQLGVQAAQVTVLPIQSDLRQFLQVGEHRVYNPHRAPAFLYVGRFAAEKNISLLLNAFASLVKIYPECSLTLLGDGPLHDEVTEQIKRHQLQGCVRVLPWTDTVPAVMAKHDVLCVSSQHEGWGMVLLEAGAAGMPVVTTDVGCAGERIIDQENGRVVPVGDESAYTDALTTYAARPELIASQGQRGYVSVRQQAPSEVEYLAQLVESFASCGQ